MLGGVTRHSHLASSCNTGNRHSDSRAVIGNLERQHMTCSFRVTIINVQKMLHRKVGALRVWTQLVDRISHKALNKRIDIYGSRAIIG